MTKQYVICSYEFCKMAVDYCRDDVYGEFFLPIYGWESVEGSYSEYETFETLEDAIARLNFAYDPEITFDNDGMAIGKREYEVEEVTFDDDGDIYDSTTIAVRTFDEEKKEIRTIFMEEE